MVATVDINSGKISGAEEGSLEYFHEKGHLEFAEHFNLLSYLQERALFFCMGFICLTFFLNFFKYFAVALFFFMVGIDIFEEYWADKYAHKHYVKVFK